MENALRRIFKVKVTRNMNKFVGFQVERSKGRTKLWQENYMTQVEKNYGLESVKEENLSLNPTENSL